MAVANIANGSNEKLKLGDLNQYRDWSYAPDVVESIWLMLQKNEPKDYVIRSGELNLVSDFVKMAFEYVGLNYLDHIEIYDLTKKQNIIHFVTQHDLGRNPKHTVKDIIKIMVDYEIERIKNKT